VCAKRCAVRAASRYDRRGMRRLAGCLVVSLLASAAAWGGCRDDLGDETLPFLIGSDGSDAAVPDAGVGEGDVGVGEGAAVVGEEDAG